MLEIHVKTFGDFSLSSEFGTINNNDNRRKKLWSILAYLTYHSKEFISKSKLIDLFFSGEQHTENPSNSLKMALYRINQMVEPILGGSKEVLITKSGDNIFMNPVYSFDIDVYSFESILKESEETSDLLKKRDLYSELFQLYTGDFLDNMQSEIWVLPLTTYYQNSMLSLFPDAIRVLEELKDYNNAILFCYKILELDSYEETFYEHLMKNLIATNQIDAAIMAYNKVSSLMKEYYSTSVGPNIAALYKQCLMIKNPRPVSLEELNSRLLSQSDALQGALFCDFDSFNQIYLSWLRFLARHQDKLHLILITIKTLSEKSSSERTIQGSMLKLKDVLQYNLRVGDVITQCTPTQFALILPNCSEEDASLVMNRIKSVYNSAYPHNSILINHTIEAIENPTHNL